MFANDGTLIKPTDIELLKDAVVCLFPAFCVERERAVAQKIVDKDAAPIGIIRGHELDPEKFCPYLELSVHLVQQIHIRENVSTSICQYWIDSIFYRRDQQQSAHDNQAPNDPPQPDTF